MRRRALLVLMCVLPLLARAQTVLFRESFEDDQFAARGWYDGRLMITDAQHFAGARCVEYRFRQGARTGESGGGIRHLFTPSDSIYVRFYVKHSANWVGSNKPYHPHEWSVLTTEDAAYVGPAYTYLTTYIEENNGHPVLAIQDGHNIDESKIGVDLTAITEQRAVAGCNGDGDGYGPGDCYLNGAQHFNGKGWKDPLVCFADGPGRYDKNDWHKCEAFFALNSIVGGKGIPNGVIQYWYDDSLLIDHHNVLMRTGAHPTMRFNQFFSGPYIGDGSPVDQTLWFDELTVATGRIVDSPATAVGEVHASPSSSALWNTPEPYSGTTTLCYAMRATTGELRVMDVLGRVVYSTIVHAQQGTIAFDGSGLPPGLYVAVLMQTGLQSGGNRKAFRMMHRVR